MVPPPIGVGGLIRGRASWWEGPQAVAGEWLEPRLGSLAATVTGCSCCSGHPGRFVILSAWFLYI